MHIRPADERLTCTYEIRVSYYVCCWLYTSANMFNEPINTINSRPSQQLRTRSGLENGCSQHVRRKFQLEVEGRGDVTYADSTVRPLLPFSLTVVLKAFTVVGSSSESSATALATVSPFCFFFELVRESFGLSLSLSLCSFSFLQSVQIWPNEGHVMLLAPGAFGWCSSLWFIVGFRVLVK